MRGKILLSILLLSGVFTCTIAQNAPRVFLLGEDEASYSKLTETYNQSLLQACNNDMNTAFEKWLELTEAIEDYANKIQYDIKGVKAWFHIFFEADGTIKHIGFLFQPDSRNINKDEFKSFLSSFSSRFQMSLVSDKKYAHYSIAGFPVHTVAFNKQ